MSTTRLLRDPHPRRVAVLSIHTSPLDQPGTGDAGGMNVYVVETAKRLAEAGTAVEIFTRSTSSAQPPVVELAPGVLVRHVTAGPFEGLLKQDLPGQLCAVTAGVMRVEAADALWMIPPDRGLWLPPGTRHEVHTRGVVEMRTIYLAPDALASLPTSCCVLITTPLLRHLILAALEEPVDYD